MLSTAQAAGEQSENASPQKKVERTARAHILSIEFCSKGFSKMSFLKRALHGKQVSRAADLPCSLSRCRCETASFMMSHEQAVRGFIPMLDPVISAKPKKNVKCLFKNETRKALVNITCQDIKSPKARSKNKFRESILRLGTFKYANRVMQSDATVETVSSS